MGVSRPDPVEAISERWRVESQKEMLEWARSNPRWVTEDEITWELAGDSGSARYRLTGSDPETIELTYVVAGWTRYAVYFALLLLPLALLSPSWLSGLFLLVVAAHVLPEDELPLQDAPATQIQRRTGWIATGLYFGAAVTIARLVGRLLPPNYRLFLIIGVMSYAATRLYSGNGLPWQSDESPKQILQVPLDLVRSGALTLMLVFGATLVGTWVRHLTTRWLEEFNGNALAAGSIGSDMTGGALRSGNQVLALLEVGQRWGPVFVLTFALYAAIAVNRVTLEDANRLYQGLSKLSQPVYESPDDLGIFKGVFVISGSIAIAVYLIAFGTIAFGVTKEWLLPDGLLQPLAFLLPPSSSQTADGLLTVTYEQFVIAATRLSLPAEWWLGVFALSFAFFPGFLIVIGAVRGVTSVISDQFRTRDGGTSSDTKKRVPRLTGYSSVFQRIFTAATVCLPGGRTLLEALAGNQTIGTTKPLTAGLKLSADSVSTQKGSIWEKGMNRMRRQIARFCFWLIRPVELYYGISAIAHTNSREANQSE